MYLPKLFQRQEFSELSYLLGGKWLKVKIIGFISIFEIT